MRQGWLTRIQAADASKATLLIDGFIGDSWDDKSLTYAQAFRQALESIPQGTPIVVGINSPGGAIDDGLSIYNAIKERGNVTTRVDGYALSIASLILQAGSVRIVPQTALVMEHDPWSGTVGNSREMRKSADVLDKHRDVIADAMASKTRRRREDVLRCMEEETWYTGTEAVAAGLADEETTKDPNFKPFDASRFNGTRIPKALAQFAITDFENLPTPKAQGEPADVGGSATEKHKEHMQTLMGILATCGIVASADVKDEQAAAQVKTWLDGRKAEDDANEAILAKTQVELEAERKAHSETRNAFAEAVVDRAVAEGKIEDKPETRAAWAKAHVADRAVAGTQLASIKAQSNKDTGHKLGQSFPEKTKESAKRPLDRVRDAFKAQIGVRN